MRLFLLPQSIIRMGLVLGVILGFSTPLLTLAQDTAPTADVQEIPAPPAPGSIQISVYGSDGMPLSGSFAVSDSSGAYQQVWATGGVASVSNVAAGTASVSQLSGSTDYAPDYAPKYVEIPAGGTASLSFMNAFLDTDGDGIGNSVDVCAAGNDRLDTDLDTIADACDSTPYGEPTPAPTAIPTTAPTPVPTLIPAAEPTTVPTIMPTAATTQGPTVEPTPDPAGSFPAATEQEEVTTLSVEVVEEPVVVAAAPVSCQEAEAVSAWIVSDLDDYPPGGLVTLSSGNWVPGQLVEILVEDDGIADAEMGEWNHRTTVTADESGGFTYSFNIAPWYVADYTVVATGECAEARTAFTDSVSVSTPGSLSACSQNPSSGDISPAQSSVVTCTLSVPNRTPGQNSTQYGGVYRPSMPAGFTASVAVTDISTPLTMPTGNTAQWMYFQFSPSSGSFRVATVTFTIYVNSTVAPGAPFSMTFQSCNAGQSSTGPCITNDSQGGPGAGSATITGQVTTFILVEGTHYTFSCTPSSLTATTFAAVQSTCTVTVSTLPANTTIRLDGITTSLSGGTTGWSVGLVSGETPFGTLPGTTALTGVTLSSGGTYNFQVRFTPTACSASANVPMVGVTIGITPLNSGSPGNPHTSSSKTVSASFTAPPSSRNASVVSAPGPVNVTYNMTTAQTGNASFTVRYTVSGCQNWSGSAQMSAFSKIDDPAATPLPVLQSASQGATTTTGAATTITNAAITTINTTPTQLLSGTAPGQQAVIDHTVNIVYSIPANTPVGTYQSTITVTTGGGP